jgi:DNA-binding MarR family transcriptional regulator
MKPTTTETYLKKLHLGANTMNAANTPVGYKSLLSDEQRQAARALRLAIEPFVELNPTIPASYIISFLAVAEKEGRPVSEYANEVGMFKAVMTRHLLDLGERDRHGGEGMNVIEQKRDRVDLRINRTFINEKGAALLSKVRRAWEMSRKG